MNLSGSVLYLVLWLVLQFNVNLTLSMSQDTMGELNERPLRRCDPHLVNCQEISEIVFLGFFPCLRQNDSSFEASKSISGCDLLAEAAAHLAVERVNGNPDILPNITLKLYPIYVPSRRESQADEGGYYDILVQMLGLLRSNYSGSVWGVVGPGDDPNVANFIAPIAENSGLITVSYGSTASDSAESISTFYRTLPSDRSANYGRLVLLEEHEWFRIGILASSKEEHYFKESSQFVLMFNKYVEKGLFNKINLDLIESFADSPNVALQNMKSRDINIIVGFFGPTNARRVLCQAESMDLISSNHAWILPSYYDPNWWKSPLNSTDHSCSDEEMREILESVIFVDTIKLPPVESTVQDFYSRLLAKAIELHPSLTEEDLKPYLLHSRATSAYDAVTLLARSVGVAFNQGGDSCTNTSVIQVVLDQEFLGCEYCQLYSVFPKCFGLSMFFKDCEECYGSDSFMITPENISHLYHYRNDSKRDYLLNDYGQILYSQFQGGEECPIILWWPGLSEKERMYRHGYIPISDFDDETKCISGNVTLSRRHFVSNTSRCLTSFDWRGSPDPPSSHFLEMFYIPLGGLITIGISVLIGFLAAILLVIFNIIWRKNKIVKSTSPWLNVILLSGIMIRLPSTLLYGLSISVIHYPSLTGRDWTPLCHIGIWQYYVGDVLFVATLIAKNWRIYKIFFNKGLKQRGNKLANDSLMIGIFLTMFPLFIILTAWSAVGIKFNTYSFQNNNLQIINYTTCFPDNSIIFDIVTNSYILFLFLFLFILSLLTASVPSSIFRREGVATYKAVVFALLPAPFMFLTRVTVLLSRNPERFEALLWVEFCWTAILPFILFVVLFVPTIHAVLRSHIEEKHVTSDENEQRQLTLQYNDLRHEADVLKVQLNQLDNNILKIKAGLALPVNPNSSDGISKTEKSTSEADVPNIDDAGTSNKVVLISTDTTSFVTTDHTKLTEAEEISDIKLHCAAGDSKTTFLSTGSTTEALVQANDSPTFDGGSPSLNSQTAASDVRASDSPCLENGDSEACNGHIDLCTSDHTKNTMSCESCCSMIANEMTILSGPTKEDSHQHLENDTNMMYHHSQQ